MRVIDHGHLSDDEILLADEPDARLQARTHLRTCPSCAARRARLRATETELLRACRLDADPADAAHRAARSSVERALALEAAGPTRGWRGSFAWYEASEPTPRVALAALTLAVFAGLRLWSGAGLAAPVHEVGTLPIAALTPGVTRAVSIDELCRGDRPAARPLPAAVRERVLRAYGMTHLSDDAYELDFLITPELGGAEDPRNLWPERYDHPVWSARVKDQLETLLPRLVCSGAVDLATAQRDIAGDWIAAYRKYFRTEVPLLTTAALGPDTDPIFEDGPMPERR